MHSLKWLTGAAVALSMTATPVLAQSAASKLSLSKAPRAATTAKKSSRIAPPPIVPIVVLVAIVAGAVLVGVSEDNDGPPASP